QGIVQGTYKTFAELANQNYGGSLKGTVILTAGPGGIGGAQPLAVTMNGRSAIFVEVDGRPIQKPLDKKYLASTTDLFEEPLEMAEAARDNGEALSIGLLGNAAEIHHEILKSGFKIDIVTDQTSAHDPLNGYVPEGYSLEKAAQLRESDAKEYVKLSSA